MIELDGVTHRYSSPAGERTVLHDVTLSLGERRVAVLGANGSGKSTLARTLNALVVPTSGVVRVNGLDTRTAAAGVRRQVGFVFSDPDAQIVMPTVAEDVAFSLRRSDLTRPAREQRVAEVLARFDLAEHADSPAHLLSGGQKQLLALAAVLVTEPDVLVCDEPTTLLDLRNTRRMAELLLALPQQVVLVTHDLDLALDYDRVVVLDEGSVVFDGGAASGVRAYRDLMAGR